MPIHYVVNNPDVNELTVEDIITNLNSRLEECTKLKIEANKKPLRGRGPLVNLSKTRIGNAKKSLPIKEQELVEQRQSVINDNNYTEDMAMAIEKFDNFAAKEYGLYFS